ncbi:MAG: NAD(P)H-binding protein [Spirochaetia bacterium]|nr:NAD(P)H-binding protein [Spirochaetia bacterium]
MKKTALILVSTGLIGGHLLAAILEDDAYEGVTCLVRPGRARALHKKLKYVETELGDMASHASAFAVDNVFCCLGTTIKKAGSQEAFRTVDYEYPLAAARLAKEKGAKAFFVVTAMGSDKNSMIFYNRVKGDLEAALAAVGLSSVHVFRPSLLSGDRKEKRPGEEMGQVVGKLFSFAFQGPLRKYKPIEGSRVARAMLACAVSPAPGFVIHESDEMQR